MAIQFLVDARTHIRSLASKKDGESFHTLYRALRRADAAVRPIVESVTSLGWCVVGLCIIGWVFGAWLGWEELLLMASTCLVVVLIAIGFVVGALGVDVEVTLDSLRVTAGATCAGSIRFRNRGTRHLLPLVVELPVGVGHLDFNVPSLGSGKSAEELFLVPTERRGVIPIGPAHSVRRDPLGVLSRRANSGVPHELIVHPRVVGLQPFGSGILRDLEGITTNEVSASDLAFHSMREYVPGDDRRHIHWRSTAKTGRLYVRQFLDTRRSSLLVLVDTKRACYGNADEFETALEIAASLVVRATRDGLQATVAAGRHGASGVAGPMILDALARAEFEEAGSDLATMSARMTTADATLVVLVSGSDGSTSTFQSAAIRYSPEVRVMGIRVVPGSDAGITASGRLTIVQVAELRDLPGIMTGSVLA